MKKMNEAYEAACRAAAALYAAANRTDPFAFSRMMAHFVQGIEHPADVIAQWKGKTLSRVIPSSKIAA